MTQRLEVDISQLDSADLLALHGELDVASALGLAGALSRIGADGEGPVVLDLSGLSFLDSTGLSMLLNARRRLSRQGRSVLVVCPPGPVRRVLELTSMLDTLRVSVSREAALVEVGQLAGDGP